MSDDYSIIIKTFDREKWPPTWLHFTDSSKPFKCLVQSADYIGPEGAKSHFKTAYNVQSHLNCRVVSYNLFLLSGNQK